MIAARLTVVLLFLIGPYFISIGNCQTDTLSDSSAIPLKKFHSLKIQLGVGPQFHLTSTTYDDPNIPIQFENPRKSHQFLPFSEMA